MHEIPTPSATSSNAAPGPRPLTRGVGLVLQVVGGVLFLGACCICGSAGLWDPVMSRGEVAQQAVDAAAMPADWGRIGAMLLVMFTTVGGLAMLVFGLGMQQDRPRAATFALLSVALFLLVLIAAGAMLWRGGGPWGLRLANLGLLVTGACLLALCIAAWREVRADPPPEGPTALPPDADLDALKAEARGRMP